MGATLFCSKCGLEVPLEDIGNPPCLSPCVACGNSVFVPAVLVRWEAALTKKDKEFLKTQRISSE